MNIPSNYLSKLTDEQKKRVEAAKTPEEFLTIAKETGYELSEGQLNAISGGWCSDCGEDNWPPDYCPGDFPPE